MTNRELTQEGKIQKLIRDSDYLTKKHPLVNRGPIVRSESISLTLEFIRKNYNKIGVSQMAHFFILKAVQFLWLKIISKKFY